MRGVRLFYHFGVLAYVIMIGKLKQRSRLRIFKTPSRLTPVNGKKAGISTLRQIDFMRKNKKLICKVLSIVSVSQLWQFLLQPLAKFHQ